MYLTPKQTGAPRLHFAGSWVTTSGLQWPFLLSYRDCSPGMGAGWPTDLTGLNFVWPRYLLDHGANIAAVNSDGDVPLDIAEADSMEALLRAEIEKRGKAQAIAANAALLPLMSYY